MSGGGAGDGSGGRDGALICGSELIDGPGLSIEGSRRGFLCRRHVDIDTW